MMTLCPKCGVQYETSLQDPECPHSRVIEESPPQARHNHIGVVLAGGLATRLPNKPLLPMRDGRPVICSSIDYLERSGCRHVVVVVPPDSVLMDVLARRSLSFIEQERPDGVPQAISLAYERLGREASLYVCSDNVFPEDDYWDQSADHPTQEVRTLPPWQAMHLSRYDGGWVERGVAGDCVAGALYLPARQLLPTHPPELSLMSDWLNAIDATPLRNARSGWHDVGTMASYRRYWR